MDLTQLSLIAINAAQAAGQVIKQYLHEDVIVEKKNTGAGYASEVVTVVDRACESVILPYLYPSCEQYDIALLSEETADDGSRLEKDFFWCIDPMDGTLPFINKQPGFSVSIALVAKDGTPHIGVVFDPSTDILYHAVRGMGAFKNHKVWQIGQSNQHLSYVTDRRLQDTARSSEIETFLSKMKNSLGLPQVKEIAGAGSVLNGIRVLENGPALMLKLPKKENGGGSIWDFAAIACIFQELGLPATNFDGGLLDLNRKDATFMNHQGIYFANLNLTR